MKKTWKFQLNSRKFKRQHFSSMPAKNYGHRKSTSSIKRDYSAWLCLIAKKIVEYCNRTNNDKLYSVRFEHCSNENSKKNLVSLTHYPKNSLSLFPSINLIILRLFMCTQSPNATESTINRSKFPLAPNNNLKLHLQEKAVIQTQEGHSVVLPPKIRKYRTTPRTR